MPISANGGPWTNSGAGIKTLTVVPVTTGDLLVLSFESATATALSSSVSGGGVTTWNAATGWLDTGNSQLNEIWWGVVTTTGSSTVTVTNSTATGTNRLHAREWTGTSGWSVLTASPATPSSGGAATGTGTTVNYPSLTGSGLYVGTAESIFGNMTGGSTSGFTYEQNNSHQEVCFNTAASNAAPTSVTDNAGGYEAVAALFGGAAAPPSATPPALLLSRFTDIVRRGAWQRADWQAQGVADLTVAFSSTSGGVDTYNVTSPYNGTGSHPMRVLKPTAPNGNYPHAFLIMLPVDADQGTAFGDSIGTAQTLNAHNAYNLTVVQPGYAQAGLAATGPWFADNPLDQTIYQETFTLLVLAWIKKNLAVAGGSAEQVYLIGFSRSGLAAQFLQFRHPYLFAAVASWDSPFMMTDYNGTDPYGTVGGSPDQVFGTSSNFTTRYALAAAYLANWQATGQYGTNRIWIGLGPGFPGDTPAYDTALSTAGIPHTYTFSNTVESHAWHTDWVAAGLQAIIPSNEPTVLPQSIVSHPIFTRLLEVAERRITTGTPAVTTWQGTATIVGAGALTANVIQGAGASLTASGLLAASVTQGAGASLAGAGTLASNIQQGSGGSFGGAGTLSVNVIQQVVAALAGTGTLSANVIQGAGASLTGLGVVASNVIQGSGGTMGGAGTLSVNATQDVIAALTGAGTLSAVVIQGATATLTGAGVVNAGSQSGGGSMSGSGSVSVNAIQGAGSPLTAAGLLAASVIQGAGLTAVASGLVTVSATELAGVTLTGLGVVTAPPAGGAKSALLLVFLP